MTDLRRILLRAIAACALAAALLPSHAAAVVRGDYRFENDLTNSSGSLPSLTPIGPGQPTFHGEIVEGSEVVVYEFPTDNGLEITPLTGMAGNVYSIVMLVRLDHVTGASRLIDFKDGASDCGFYVVDGAPAIECGAAGMPSICANTWVQVVLTRSANDTVRIYVNGNLQLEYDDTAGDTALTEESLRFFRDNECTFPCGEESGGAVARILVHDTVLRRNFIEDLVVQECGDLNSSGTITASDALGALKAAVGTGCCQIEFCDVAEPPGVLASDALAILKAAVDQEIDLSCG